MPGLWERTVERVNRNGLELTFSLALRFWLRFAKSTQTDEFMRALKTKIAPESALFGPGSSTTSFVVQSGDEGLSPEQPRK